MQNQDDLSNYNFFKKIKKDFAHQFLTAYMLNYDNVDGKDILIPKDNRACVLDYKDIEAIIKGLQNFLEVTSQETIDNFNKSKKERQRKLNHEHYKERFDKQEKEKVKGFVYLLKIEGKNQYKIGVTKNLNKRLKQISPKMPFELKIEHKIKHNDIYGMEDELHNKFDDKRIKGEWFKLNDNDVNYIKGL